MPGSLPGSRRLPDRSAALAQYRRRAGVYDQELAPFEPIRTEAIECLQLHQGQTVLDVGCGTGLSFELLHSRVGRHGARPHESCGGSHCRRSKPSIRGEAGIPSRST